MRFELAVSLRYFRSRRAEGALSFITAIAIGGVTLGVAALVVAMAVMNGYQTNLVQAMAGALPHVSLHGLLDGSLPKEEELRPVLEQNLHPQAVSPYILHEALLTGPQSGTGGVQGVLVRAIDPATESNVGELLAFLSDGSPEWKELAPAERERRARDLLLGLRATPEPNTAPCLISPLLADKLGVHIGDNLVPLRFPREGEGFSPHPSATRLRVAGFFATGIVAFDELVVLMDVAQAPVMFPGQPMSRALGIRLADPLTASQAADWLRAEMQRQKRSVYVYSWLEANSGLFKVISVQKSMLFVVLLLIVLLAFFGMISALVMLVAEKSREITILACLGTRRRSIYRIFLVQGLLIGLSGTVLGLLAGLFGCYALDTFSLFEIPPGVYPGSDHVPVRVDVMDLVWVVGATLLICVGATMYPARKAVAVRPAEGLRYG